MRPSTAVYYVTAGVSRRAFVRQQIEQEGAQHIALWRASAEGAGGGDGVEDPDDHRSEPMHTGFLSHK